MYCRCRTKAWSVNELFFMSCRRIAIKGPSRPAVRSWHRANYYLVLWAMSANHSTFGGCHGERENENGSRQNPGDPSHCNKAMSIVDEPEIRFCPHLVILCSYIDGLPARLLPSTKYLLLRTRRFRRRRTQRARSRPCLLSSPPTIHLFDSHPGAEMT